MIVIARRRAEQDKDIVLEEIHHNTRRDSIRLISRHVLSPRVLGLLHTGHDACLLPGQETLEHLQIVVDVRMIEGPCVRVGKDHSPGCGHRCRNANCRHFHEEVDEHQHERVERMDVGSQPGLALKPFQRI